MGRRRQRQLELLRLRPHQVAGRRSGGRRDRDARADRRVRCGGFRGRRQRLLDLESSQAMVRAAADAVRSAAEARRVVADRFSAGVATSTDVLVAQVALLETELARTRALAALRLAEARLERSVGQHGRVSCAIDVRGLTRRFGIVRRGQGPVVLREAGRDLRLPRRQRRRQVHDDPHAVRVVEANDRHGARRRHRRQPRSRRREAPHRLHVAEVLALRGADRRSEHPVLRRHLRTARRRFEATARVRARHGGPRPAARTR